MFTGRCNSVSCRGSQWADEARGQGSQGVGEARSMGAEEAREQGGARSRGAVGARGRRS